MLRLCLRLWLGLGLYFSIEDRMRVIGKYCARLIKEVKITVWV